MITTYTWRHKMTSTDFVTSQWRHFCNIINCFMQWTKRFENNILCVFRAKLRQIIAKHTLNEQILEIRIWRHTKKMLAKNDTFQRFEAILAGLVYVWALMTVFFKVPFRSAKYSKPPPLTVFCGTERNFIFFLASITYSLLIMFAYNWRHILTSPDVMTSQWRHFRLLKKNTCTTQ